MTKKIGETHIRWYEPDRKLISAIRRMAKKADCDIQEQVKVMLWRVKLEMERDEQIARNADWGKMKKLPKGW